MNSNLVGLGREIQEAMAQVRGARVRQDSAEAVDETLNDLRERAVSLGASERLVSALGEAQQAFSEGDTARAIQRLSFALVQCSRGPHG